MHKVELKTVEMGRIGGTDFPPLAFGDGIKGLMEAKEGGMQLQELRQCLRVCRAVDASTKGERAYVLLEDQDWVYLKQRLDAHKFPFACEAFDQFSTAIEDAVSFDPNALEPGPPAESDNS